MTNGKGLCEGGAKKVETYYKHEPEQKPFSFFKLTKNKKTKWLFAAKSAKIFNARELHPRFCKTHVGGWLRCLLVIFLNFV